MSIARGQDSVAHHLVDPKLVDHSSMRLKRLCQGAGFGAETDRVIETFRRLLAPWGQIPVGPSGPGAGASPGWVSEIGDDHSPLEFSVAIIDGEPEVRVLLEAQGDAPTLQSQCTAGVAFTERLGRQFGAGLVRFRRIADLFLPEELDPQARFAVWNAVCFSPGRAPRFKVYLNPQATGREHAQALIEEALDRLGFPHAWPVLGATALRRGPLLDEIKYFSLDLADEPGARVKVYVHHHQATPEDLEVACSAARNYVPGEASAFARTVSGGTLWFAARAPFTCPSFVSGDLPGTGPASPERPEHPEHPEHDHRPAETTLYIPVCAYAHNDAVVRQRISHALVSRDIDPTLYQHILTTFANRPLDVGVGMQSWVALRRQRGRVRLTVYLSTESRKVYPPGSVPAGTFDEHMFPSAEALMQAIDNLGLAQHPFLQRLMLNPKDTESLWLLITNAYEGTSRHFIRWLAMVTARIEDDRMRCLLARQLHEELGQGDFARAHSVLMSGFLESIAIWRPADFDERRHLQPGYRLGERLGRHYLAEDGYEGAAALMAGEICAQQLIEVVACLIAAQPHVLAPDMLDWLSLHDELESDHADESLVLARMIPAAPKTLAAVMRGGMGLYQALWNFLDEMYQLCFVERRHTGKVPVFGSDAARESAARGRLASALA